MTEKGRGLAQQGPKARVRTTLSTILRLTKGRRPGLGYPPDFAQLAAKVLGSWV